MCGRRSVPMFPEGFTLRMSHTSAIQALTKDRGLLLENAREKTMVLADSPSLLRSRGPAHGAGYDGGPMLRRTTTCAVRPAGKNARVLLGYADPRDIVSPMPELSLANIVLISFRASPGSRYSRNPPSAAYAGPDRVAR